MSRSFSVFITYEEFLKVLLKVSELQSFFGAVRFWSSTECIAICSSSIPEGRKIGDISSLVLRSDPYFGDPENAFKQPTVEGFVHLTAPRIFEPGILAEATVAVREHDQNSSLSNPLVLYKILVKEMRSVATIGLRAYQDGMRARPLRVTYDIYASPSALDQGARLTGGVNSQIEFLPD